jgi:dTDP-4-dehydrorhamnose reductase
MRILVLGGTGMLGHKMTQVLAQDHEVWVTARCQYDAVGSMGFFEEHRFLGGSGIGDGDLDRAIDAARPEAVINCVGVVKQVAAARDPIQEIEINSVLPHRLHRLCSERGVLLVHVSTDCVFSGQTGGYSEDSVPDATDLYGRSKLLGEVTGPSALTLRTSIIGRELFTSHGLVEWFLAQAGPDVPGFARAVFSGFPTLELARIVRDVVLPRRLTGLWHVSADPISKWELLGLLAQAFGREVRIERVELPVLNRSLDSARFRTVTGFEPSSWPDLVRAMADDAEPYDRWRAPYASAATRRH